MDIRVIPIEQINAAAYNPRVDQQPGDPEYEKLKRSIEEFGYVEPIVWNERTGNMVGGHQRYKIMVNEQGLSELEVSVVDLDDDQENWPLTRYLVVGMKERSLGRAAGKRGGSLTVRV